MDGGKLSLRLVTAGESVEYAAELLAGEESFQARVTVAPDGAVTVDGASGAPDWLIVLTRAVLRTAWRSHATGTPWPRRLTRWRPSSESPETPE